MPLIAFGLADAGARDIRMGLPSGVAMV